MEGESGRGGYRALGEHEDVLAALEGAAVDLERVLAALRLIGGLRAHLDEAERRLIEVAREQDASWSRIASCLGLASRQAAEQRLLRLSGESKRDPAPTRTARLRQRTVDDAYGRAVSQLRAAVRAAYRSIEADPDWDERYPRAALTRATLESAAAADPGALFDLAREAVTDLDGAPRDVAGSAPALRRLREALDSADPTHRS